MIASMPRVTYPDDDGKMFSTFSHLATRSVIAAIDDYTGKPQTLTLGASSDVVLDAARNVQLHVKNGGCLAMYNSIDDKKTLFASIHHNPVTKEVTLSTGNDDLVLNSPLVHVNDLQVHGHFSIDGGVISNNLNVVRYKTDSNNTESSFCTGYGFRINDRDELELVKYAMFDTEEQQSSVFKKVAIFGNGGSFRRDEATVANNTFLPFNANDIQMGSNVPQIPRPSNKQSPCSSLWKYDSNARTLVIHDESSTFKVGVNVNDPQHDFHVKGAIGCDSMRANLIVTTDMTFLSDRRLKTDISPIADTYDCLQKINGLQLVHFKYRGDESRVRIGVIAQQVEEVGMSEAVLTTSNAALDDCKAVDTNAVMAYLVGAVQALSSLVSKLI